MAAKNKALIVLGLLTRVKPGIELRKFLEFFAPRKNLGAPCVFSGKDLRKGTPYFQD
jgi:hypothetical protein